MPIGETLTLLTTLASAFQALRTTRPDGAANTEPEPIIDPALLLALDATKSANDETIRRHEAAASRIQWLVGLSAAALLLSAFLGAVSSDSPDAGAPLFIVSVVIFVVVAIGAVVLRRALGLSSVPTDDVTLGSSTDGLEKLLQRRQHAERRNRGRLVAVDIGGDALLLVVALQVILAALWLID